MRSFFISVHQLDFIIKDCQSRTVYGFYLKICRLKAIILSLYIGGNKAHLFGQKYSPGYKKLKLLRLSWGVDFTWVSPGHPIINCNRNLSSSSDRGELPLDQLCRSAFDRCGMRANRFRKGIKRECDHFTVDAYLRKVVTQLL